MDNSWWSYSIVWVSTYPSLGDGCRYPYSQLLKKKLVPLFQVPAWHRTNLVMARLYRLVRKHVEHDARSAILLWKCLGPLLAGKSSHQVWTWLLQAMLLLTTPQMLELLTIDWLLRRILCTHKSVAVHLQIFILLLLQFQETIRAVLTQILTALVGITVIHCRPTVIQLHYHHPHHQVKQVFRLTPPAQNHVWRKNLIFLQYKRRTLILVQVLHRTHCLLFLLWKK